MNWVDNSVSWVMGLNDKSPAWWIRAILIMMVLYIVGGWAGG